MTQEQNPAIFDHVRLNSICVKLNGTRYPTDNIDIDYTKNDYVRLYKMAEDFKKEYYGFNNLIGGTQINFPRFKSLYPIIVLDLRYQSEQLRSNVMNIKLEMKFDEAVPAETHLYGVIISDRLFKLNYEGQIPRMETY